MQTINDNLKNIISEYLENVYYCEREWSAWSYNTMTIDDFIELWNDEDTLNDISKKIIDNKSSLTSESLSNCFSWIDAYHNDCLDYNFESQYFNNCWFEEIDFDEMLPRIKQILIKLKINSF
jgi:hypothetical protein